MIKCIKQFISAVLLHGNHTGFLLRLTYQLQVHRNILFTMGDLAAKLYSFTKEWHSAPYPFISPARPELSCAGKNIVVTGGATGIGYAVSLAFAQAGAKSVTILGRRPEKLQEAVDTISKAVAGAGTTQVLSRVTDLANRDQVTEALNSVADKVGKLDVLVSNAATSVVIGGLDKLSPEDLLSALNHNVIGALNATQVFLSLAGPEPMILSTTTSLATWAPDPMFGTYSISKAAALKMFDVLQAENPQLHVVSIQPGYVATSLNGHQKDATDSGKLYVRSKKIGC